ncbi:DUF5590 domain-containing protein [Paenibacillus allorhizosphaerae]|uniref:Cell wall elongation regulator TseB-like domain-containing protein n=1 Tax=Paenibacillus allorhizosphaerae TaxID=2849866 RepID=A0ABN7TNM1_9BACL|nr:DUF5590 domain-containing protein [Paenibacillus allorhizosphaerae]CAG7648775.1 hypothetical protein PAECIP111802_04320 [Paenibacillus allorhizosphaerae]
MVMQTKWKVILLLSAIVIVAVALSSWFFNSVMKEEWNRERAAVLSAYEKTILTKAVKVDRFVGQKPYTVIQGEDKIGQPVVVWVAEDEIRSEMAAGGITAQQAELATMERHADATIVRALPGIMNNAPVWEIFYKLPPGEEKKDQYFYDYYTFKDGQLMDTWRLSIR